MADEQEHWSLEDYQEYQRTGRTPEQAQELQTGSNQGKEAPKPTKADLRDEKRLQTLCEQELHRRDIAYLHLSYRAREKKGWPDLTFALFTYPIAVELKSETGRLSQDQIECLTLMRENGWKVYVLRNIKDFVDMLNGHPVKEWEK